MKIWINNKIFSAKNAKISVFDRGFLYGDGIFETMRCYGGKIFKLSEHLARLFHSAKTVNIKVPYSGIKLAKAVNKTLEFNKSKDAYARITVTRGESAFSLAGGAEIGSNVVITVKEFTGYPGRFYSSGITAKISQIRQNEKSDLSKIKSANFLNHILARIDAQNEGFDEAILMNIAGDVAEAVTSNIFLIKKEALITPSLDSGILPGITRSAVIRIALNLGMKVRERRVSRKELLSADEIFLTNSLAEILPVVKIGSVKVGAGCPGRITKLLHKAYRQMV